MNLKKLNIFLLSLLFVTTAQSDDAKDLENNHKYNFYTGTFDVIDKEGDDQTTLFGVEHKNEDLFRNTFLGKFSPLTGAFMTGNESMYLYSGIQAEYNLGLVTNTPSFAPGYYNSDNGKDLGHALEFKSEVQMSLNLSETSEFGMSYNHISNASLGKKNPGANSYMFNFIKQF